MATTPNRIDTTPTRMNTQLAEDRQTPQTDFGSRLRDGMETTTQVAGVVASALPGGAILSAAVSAGTSLAGNVASAAGTSHLTSSSSVTGTTGTTGSGSASTSSALSDPSSANTYQQAQSLLAQQEASNMQYLGLQQQCNDQNQKYTCLSNVIKIRYDTTKNTIANVH